MSESPDADVAVDDELAVGVDEGTVAADDGDDGGDAGSDADA